MTDRYAVYLCLGDTHRQFRLAHLARDLTALGERDGSPGRRARKLSGVLEACSARCRPQAVTPPTSPACARTSPGTAKQLHDLLLSGARCRDPKTRRFCQGLLDHETALWTFTRIANVPATDNASEQALRHAVHWPRTSYGTQTDQENRIIERFLTLPETCRLQRRRHHNYLPDAITADLHGPPIPSILPAQS